MRRAVVGLGLALVAAAPGRGDAQTVVFGVGGQLTGQTGATIGVPVYVDMTGAPGQKLGSYTVRLEWDPAVLYYVTTDPGAFSQPLVVTDSVWLGILRVGGLSVDGVEGVFTLFTVQLAVTANATSAFTLAVGEATAARTFADLTSLVTVVSGTYCAAAGRWGDLDGDGQANSRDALAILSAIVGLPVNPAFTLALGDVDGDGVVNSRDALITLSHAVGLAIPGQRVLVYAPGACGGSGPLGISILPDTVDVAVGQYTRLLVSGAIGGLPAGTVASWSVGNPELAVVTAEGVLVGRAAGTTTVTVALGPGITATVPVIVRARRFNWIVDAARAPLAAIQLGTQRYPFATPQYAFPIAQDGDTVRIAPGTHDYIGGDFCNGGGYGGGDAPPAGSPPPEWCTPYGELRRSIVMWGDTLPDGTRPVLRGNPDNDRVVELYGGVTFEMHNLVLRGFDDGIYQYEPTRKVLIQNVLFDLTSPYSYDGINLYYGLDTLILRNVRFVGDSATSSGGAVYADDGISLAILDRVVVDNVRSGIYLYGVDSLDIRDSDLRPSLYDPLYIDGSVAGARVYLARNRFRGVYDAPMYLYDVRSVISERNVYQAGGSSYGMQIYGRVYPPQPGSRFRSLADSVIGEPRTGTYEYGFYIDDLDTIRLDSAVVTGPDSGFVLYPGYLYGGTEARVLGSRFENVSGDELFLGARNVEVSNSSFTGCRAGCSTPYGIWAEGYVDSLALLQVTGNTFFRLYNAVQAYQYGDVHRAEISGNTLDSVSYYALTVHADTSVITDNVLTRAAYGNGVGIYLAPRYPRTGTAATVQRNQVTALAGYALYGTSAHLASTGNRYTGRAYSVYLPNPAGTAWQVTMDRDTVVADSSQGGYTLYLTGGVAGSVKSSRILGGNYGLYANGTSGTLVLDSNVVSGSRTYGMYLSAPVGTSITGQWNNVTDNRAYGIYATGAATYAFTNGRFVLNRNRAIYASGSSVDATANWWGAVGGPGPGTGGDSVFGSVTTTGFLTSDPLGVSVPPLAPPAGAFVADLWRAPIGSRRSGASVTTPAPAELPAMTDDRAERAAWRTAQKAEALSRARERQLERERLRVQREEEIRSRR